MIRYFVTMSLISFGALVSTPAWGWGQYGHAVMCEMAYQQLSQDVRAKVDTLMRAHPDDEDLNTACAWADRQPRKKPRQHYVNFPRDQKEIETQTCGEAARCIFTALRDDALRLGDQNRSDQSRAEAMILLGHWIGDLHQPLHVGFSDDRGGNSVHIRRGAKNGRAARPCRPGTYNLHAVWDTCLVEANAPQRTESTKRILGRETGLDIDAHAAALLAQFADGQRLAWTLDDVTDWAQESLDIARDPVVRYCRLRDNTNFCAYEAERDIFVEDEDAKYDGARSMTVTHGYVDSAAPIAEERLVRAASRYAAVLEEILSDPKSSGVVD